MQISRETIGALLGGGGSVVEARKALDTCAQSMGCTEAHIIIADKNRLVRISSGYEPDPKSLTFDIGCISKLVTVATFLQVTGQEKGVLDSKVSEFLDLDRRGWNSDIRVKDLINHSHGADENLEQRLPFTPEGRIDVPSLLAAIGPEPLFSPGKYSSYSALGMRLLASILERRVREPFINIVRQTFPTTSFDTDGSAGLCPAFGRIPVNAEDLLRQLVLRTSFGSQLAGRVRLGPAHTVEHAGWHPLELGICNGWKAYRHGWYGHLSQLPGGPSTRVQVSPSDGIGILVTCTGGSMWKLFYSMLSADLVGAPNALPTPGARGPREGARPAVLGDFAGVYSRVDIDLLVSQESGGLVLEARNKGCGSTGSATTNIYRARIQALPGRLFALVPPRPELDLGIIEFLPGEEGRISHLWNKGRLWRRV